MEIASEILKQGVDLEKYEDMLSGEINPIREYYITLGQSSNSKGVMFVLYSYLKKCSSPYVNPFIYLGNLGIKFETAVKNARTKVGKFQIVIEDYETLNVRRDNNTIPFGKYRGLSVEDLFDKDPKYLFWLSNNANIKSKKLNSQLEQYRLLAKEIIIEENKEKSLDFLPLDAKKVERKLTIYKYFVNDFGNQYRLTDSDGNKYSYSGKRLGENGEEITLLCKVTGGFSSMGVNFNKINLR